jgi:hypothetical protein
MSLNKEQIQQYIKDLQLNLWGPINVIWNDDIKRVHLIVSDSQSQIVKAKIEADVATNITDGIISENDAEEFLKSLSVTDYAQED